MSISTIQTSLLIPAPVGRPKINHEQVMARFREGTLARLKAVLRPGEKQSDFIREAVEKELERREKPEKDD